MTRSIINPGTVEWSGEHWISYLRRPGDESNSAMVSLYHTRYSPAGEGTVALVDVTGEPGLKGVCTDSREVADFVLDKLVGVSSTPWDPGLPLVDAEITRGGDIREAPSWTIRAGSNLIETTWSRIGPALIAEGDSPTFTEGFDFFTLLFFADASSIALNGLPSEGAPYQVDTWERSLGGGQRSSCVFALAETKIKLVG